MLESKVFGRGNWRHIDHETQKDSEKMNLFKLGFDKLLRDI